MKILAIETSTRYLCMALSDVGKEYGFRLETDRKLSCLLVPEIERVVKAAGWKLSEIDCFGCGIGPGSFTAVRIGMAAVKAFAWTFGKPVAGVSSLELIAANCAASGAATVIAVIDAKRSMVYTGIFAVKAGRLVRTLVEPLLLTPEEFSDKIHKKYCASPKKACILVGDGIPVLAAGHPGLRQALGPERCADKDYWYPQPQQLLAAVRSHIAAGHSVDAKNIEPLYLYPPECQVRRA